MDTWEPTSAEQQSVLQIILPVDAASIEVKHSFGEISSFVAVEINMGCPANFVQDPVDHVQVSRAEAQAMLIVAQHFKSGLHELPLKTLAATAGQSRQLPQGNIFVREIDDFSQFGPDVESGSCDTAIATSDGAARWLRSKNEPAAWPEKAGV